MVRGGSRARSATDVEIRIGDVTRPETLAPAMAGVDAVVHLVAIPRDYNGGADLRLVNTEGTRAVVAAMREAGVRRLVHMSAMGVVDDPTLHYASSKAKAEALVRDSGLGWTILKPSLQFGEGDGFFNIIAGLVRLSPGVVPVPGDGSARFQPIHVNDVAAVVVRSIADPTSIGGTFELGGPRYWTYREITREVLSALGKRRAILPMPVPLIRLVAGTAERVHIPFPVATDQLRQLKLDNIGPLDLIPSRFGFQPRPMEGALGYLKDPQRDQVAEPGRPPTRRGRHDPAAVGRSAASSGSRSSWSSRSARPDSSPRSTTRPGRPGGRTSRTPGDAEVTPQLDAAEAAFAALADQVDALGTEARAALSALNGADATPARRPSRTATTSCRGSSPGPALLREALADVPYVGTPAAGLTVSDAVVARHAALVAALDATDGLDAAWTRLTIGSVAASTMSRLLAEHDRLVVAAADRGVSAKYADAIKVLDRAKAQIAAARALRDSLSATVDVSVLDEWLTRNENYDVALGNLYKAISKVGTKVTKATRAAVDGGGRGARAAATGHPRPGRDHGRDRAGRDEPGGHRHRGGAGQAGRRARRRDRADARATHPRATDGP